MIKIACELTTVKCTKDARRWLQKFALHATKLHKNVKAPSAGCCDSLLSLEEKLILHMLSSVKHSSGSYESASETSDQTVAHCQDRLQKLLCIMCSYRVSGPTSIPQSFLRTFLKLCSNSVHFKKRRSIEQAFSKCQEHNAWHAVHTTVSAQILAISPWWHDFCGKYETIYPVFKNHSCSLLFSPIPANENFPQTRFSSCCQPSIFLSQ